MNTRTIKLKIHEESDLFSPFDPDQEMLSEEIVSHLSRSFQRVHKSKLENYVLEIKSDTPVDEENVKQKIRNFVSEEMDAVNTSLKRLTMKAACLAVFGFVVLSIWFVLSADASSVRLEILSIIGWVAIWEATSITIIGKHDLHELRRTFRKMSEAEIKIEVVPMQDEE